MVKNPGPIVLIGSGEISPAGRKIHDFLFSKLPYPVKVAILETPAGFQPNVDRVSLQIKTFMEHSLQNYNPQITIIKARKKGTSYDPNDERIANPVLSANYIFAGPGSPTYAVKNLRDTLLMKQILRRHREGAVLSVASAAAIAMGKYTLPVYEIFKAGADLYWEEGLNVFENFGFKLAIVTHWNNKEGGEKLDTLRCYMGYVRFKKLLGMLKKPATVLGIDELTACIFDFENMSCKVMGQGGVTVVKVGKEFRFESGSSFSFEKLAFDDRLKL